MAAWSTLERLATGTLLTIALVLTLSAVASQACSCMYFHPQDHYCTADFVALVIVRREGKTTPSVRSYHVKVRRVFKATEKAIDGLSRGLLWTPAMDSLCGVQLKQNRRYLIAGSMSGTKPWVTLCSFSHEWNSLSRKQKKGFQRLYRQGCNCTVRMYPSHGHRPQCEWQTAFPGSHSEDCQSKHAICVPYPFHEQQGCTWLGGQHYRECMKKWRNNRKREREDEP